MYPSDAGLSNSAIETKFEVPNTVLCIGLITTHCLVFLFLISIGDPFEGI